MPHNGTMANKAARGALDYTLRYFGPVRARDKQMRPGADLIKNRHPRFYARFTEPLLSPSA